jgi:hypothetical protein
MSRNLGTIIWTPQIHANETDIPASSALPQRKYLIRNARVRCQSKVFQKIHDGLQSERPAAHPPKAIRVESLTVPVTVSGWAKKTKIAWGVVIAWQYTQHYPDLIYY